MTKIHLILKKKALMGVSLKLASLFFRYFFQKIKDLQNILVPFLSKSDKKKGFSNYFSFFFGWCFFAEKANPYEKKSKK